MNCEFIERCPVFAQCQTGVIKGVFSIKYCQGRLLEDCERRKLKKSGQEVPVTLLPNGDHLT